MNTRIFDLDLKKDKDEMLYEFRVVSISKNIAKKSILIDLYNLKYDYDLLDKQSQKNPDRMDLDDSDYDSDLVDLI